MWNTLCVPKDEQGGVTEGRKPRRATQAVSHSEGILLPSGCHGGLWARLGQDLCHFRDDPMLAMWGIRA